VIAVLHAHLDVDEHARAATVNLIGGRAQYL